MQIPIAIVLNSFAPGGTEHQMTELMCRLDRDRFRLFAACLGDQGDLRDKVRNAGIPVVEFPVHGLASTATARQLVRFGRWCRTNGIQIVHTCDFYANVFALPAAWLAMVPVRIGSRRDLFIPERSAAKQALQRLSYRFANRVVANSAAAREYVVSEGIRPDKITVIVNGLDASRFRPAAARGRRRTVLTVAHLRPGKGHEVLLRAVPTVLRRVPDVRFVIAGDGSRRAELEQLSRQLGLERAVTFAGHQHDIAATLHTGDIFAFPSLMEASPNAVLEAMAAGLPVVATRAGGIPEAIDDGRTGLLTRPGDPDDLARAILMLLENDALATQIAADGRHSVEQRFSFEQMTRAFEALYLRELRASGDRLFRQVPGAERPGTHATAGGASDEHEFSGT